VTRTFESLDSFLGARMPYLRKIRSAATILSSVEVDSVSRPLRLDSSSLEAGPKEASLDGSCIVGLSSRGADLVVVGGADVNDIGDLDGGADLDDVGADSGDSGDVGGVDLIDVGGVDLIDGGDLLALPFLIIESV
jgi:hypothetical protein